MIWDAAQFILLSMLGKARRILVISSILLVSLTFSYLSSAQEAIQDEPGAAAEEKCAAGYSFHSSTRECVACNQPCKTGKPGICGRGIWNCEGRGPVCEPTINPGERMELCNGEDDDCNGRIDDGFDRDDDGYTTCSGDCNDRDASVHPDAVERCDGADNNCNGLIDDGFNVGGRCTVGLGVCQASGRISCRPDGSGAVCDAAPGGPAQEICDGLDNDCDGKVDEDLGEISCGVGACMRRVAACSGGKAAQCAPAEPGPELCGDDIDNNCDGKVDEGYADLGRTCYEGVGACKAAGKMICSADGLSLTCSAKPAEPAAEICGNGIDDDCDGQIDTDAPGLGGACSNNLLGMCARDGVFVCKPATGELECSVGPVASAKEICDGLDNDCDGEIDEEVQNECKGCGELPGKIGEKCRVSGGDECATGLFACSAEEKGAATCSFDAAMTDGAKCMTDENPCTIDVCRNGRCSHEPAAGGLSCDDGDSCTMNEVCIEGECAGGIMLACDDNNECTEDSCDAALGCIHDPIGRGSKNACGGCADLPAVPGSECAIAEKTGPCAKGVYICQPDGLMVCVQSLFGRAEECNGIDDDCDGEVDEDLGARQCGIGACMREVAACQDGKEVRCLPGDPVPEKCSNMGVDDDCNGVVDDVTGGGKACAVTVGTCVIRGKLSCLGDAENMICVPANPADAQDDDSDGTPNYCEKDGGGAAPAAAESLSSVGSGGLFDPARTRASVIPWREVYDSIVLHPSSPESAILLVSGSTDDKAGFAVLRAKDAAKEQFSFTACESSVGEHPVLIVAAEKDGSVFASTGRGYLRYHKISSQIPSPDAGDKSCRLYGERLQIPDAREFSTKHGRTACDVKSIESMTILGESPLAFAGAVRCGTRLGASRARVSETLGLDVVSAENGMALSHEFVPVIAEAGEIEGVRITALGQGKRPPIFVAARADGKSSIGICRHSPEQGWRCELSEAPEIDSPAVFVLRVDQGKGPFEVLVVSEDGEAYLARQAKEGWKMTLSSSGRAASATIGGRVEDAVEAKGGAAVQSYVVVGQERSVSAASMSRVADGSLMLYPHGGGRFEPRSAQDDVSPGGKFSFNAPHAMAAMPLKDYGGSDLFAAFEMQKAGRVVGSMGFIYWNSNEAPSGRISDIGFNGVLGKARFAFTDPTGDKLKYRAWIRARHGGALDHWIDGIEDGWLRFSPKGDASAVGLWPIEITVEATDVAGASVRSKAVLGRNGAVESITEISGKP